MSSIEKRDLFEKTQQLPEIAALTAAVGSGLPTPVYLVGGCIRDLLLGKQPVDVDVCVEGEIDPLLQRLGGSQLVHTRFGTATVRRGALNCDIAQTRSELYPAPGALPVVGPAAIEIDLRRRDFTVNAIAVCLNAERAGAVIAFPGAFEDLEAGRLRVLHERSFVDDPTRLLRLARYASRLRFTVADSTRRLATEAVAAAAVETLSGTRLGNEIRLLLSEADPVDAFATLAALGLDAAIWPGFGLGPEPCDRAAVARNALALLPADGRRDLEVMAVAVTQLSKQEAAQLLDQLGFTAADRDVVRDAHQRSLTLSAALVSASRPSQIAHLIGGASVEAVALAGALGAPEQAREWLERLRHMRLSIDGNDIAAAGIEPGPSIGLGLRAATAALLDGAAGDHDSQLRVALEAARAG